MTAQTLPPIPRRPPARTTPPTFAPVDPMAGCVDFYVLPSGDAPGVPLCVVSEWAAFGYAMPTTYPVTLSWRRARQALEERVPLPRTVLDHIHPSPEGQAWLDSLPVAYRIVNLTPHAVNVVGPARWGTHGDRSSIYVIPTAGRPARLRQQDVGKGALLDPRTPPLRHLGEVSQLPDPEPGTLYLVSMAVAREYTDGRRDDLITPGTKSPLGIPGCEDFVRYV